MEGRRGIVGEDHFWRTNAMMNECAEEQICCSTNLQTSNALVDKPAVCFEHQESKMKRETIVLPWSYFKSHFKALPFHLIASKKTFTLLEGKGEAS
jgi:hypothetical protein